MSALTAVFRILQADNDISAKVGSRRFPVELPQGTALPALVVTLVSENDDSHLGGHNQYPLARFLVDCIAGPNPADYQSADHLGDLVKAALMDYRGNIDSFAITRISLDGVDHFDKGESGQHWRRRVGFMMRYRVSD